MNLNHFHHATHEKLRQILRPTLPSPTPAPTAFPTAAAISYTCAYSLPHCQPRRAKAAAGADPDRRSRARVEVLTGRLDLYRTALATLGLCSAASTAVGS
jgi:hypothetical protein